MKQNEINRAVARATGETITTIRQLGFSIEEFPEEINQDAQCIDWDQFDQPSQKQKEDDSHALV